LFDKKENALYVNDLSSFRVRRIDLQGRNVKTFAGKCKGFLDGPGLGAHFSEISGIAKYHKWDELYVADSGNHRIRKITSNGAVSVFAGSDHVGSVDGDGTKAYFYRPYAIAIDQRCGDLFVSDFEAQKIRRITQQGKVTTIASQFAFSLPAGLCFVEKDECLYIADSGHNAIQKFDFRTGSVTTVAGTQKGFWDGDGTVAMFDKPWDVAYVARDDSLLVADRCNHAIRRIKFTGGKNCVVETVAGSGQCGLNDGPFLSARFNNPMFLCVDDSSGVCYVSDAYNHCIRHLPLG